MPRLPSRWRVDRSPNVHRRSTTPDDDGAVLEATRLRSTHPWIHVNTVVFANDSIGFDEDGQPTRVDHDVVVTRIASTPDGAVLVELRRCDRTRSR